MNRFSDVNSIVDFILNEWSKLGMFLNESESIHLQTSLTSGYALSDLVVARINEYIHRQVPHETAPEWLNDIDEYFFSHRTPLPSQFSFHPFATVCELLTPLIYFDDIIKMKSFDESFIMNLELAFITRLEIPRNLEEAKRIYFTILSFPQEYTYKTIHGVKTVPQAYKAQMCFAVLIIGRADINSAVWTFQKECLEQCPVYLLDIPDLPQQGFSYRPAFWLAYRVNDAMFRDILLRRGSNEIRRNLESVLEFERKRASVSADLATESLPDPRPLMERVPESQHELAALLNQLDAYLNQNAKDLYQALLPGVNDDQITKLNQRLAPLRIPEALATLYKWHNGTSHRGFLLGYPDFDTIEGALFHYREAIESGDKFGWCKAWFTLSCEKIYRLISLTEQPMHDSPLYWYDIECGNVEVHHESLKAMMRTYLQAYKEGAIYLDKSNGYWEINDEEFDKIRLQHSPKAYCRPDQTEWKYDSSDVTHWPELWKKYQMGPSWMQR